MKPEDIRRLDRKELEARFLQLQNSYVNILSEKGSLMKDMNERMQLHLTEVRHLKEVVAKSHEEQQELRDLCCFLDDDRQRCLKQSKEWQRFGRYTAEVMRCEVAAYQKKLDALETSQKTLVKENYDLKKLCLDLSEDFYGGGLISRFSGDGSSSPSPSADKLANSDPSLNSALQDQGSGSSLSGNVNRLKGSLSPEGRQAPVRFFSTPQLDMEPTSTEEKTKPNYKSTITLQLQGSKLQKENAGMRSETEAQSNSVDQYMKVLDLYERVDDESKPENDDLNQDEKAIVKEMCNVVWRKLGDAVPGYKTPV